MKRKNPILLPGKELWSIHYEAITAGRMPESLKKRELTPLFNLAVKRHWLEKKEAQEMLEASCKGLTDKVWSKCQLYITGLNPREEEDGPAIGAWLALYNIVKYNNLVKSLRPPYLGLQINEMGRISDHLLKAIEVEIIEQKFLNETKRHFLGLIICQLCSYNPDWKPKGDGKMGYNWNTLTKEMFGKDYYLYNLGQETNRQWILTPSHGISRQGKWILPPLGLVEAQIKELYKVLPINKNSVLEMLRNKLSI